MTPINKRFVGVDRQDASVIVNKHRKIWLIGQDENVFDNTPFVERERI